MASGETDRNVDGGAWFDEEALESGRVRVHRLPFAAQPVSPEYEVYVIGENAAMGGDRCLIPSGSDHRTPDAPSTPSPS